MKDFCTTNNISNKLKLKNSLLKLAPYISVGDDVISLTDNLLSTVKKVSKKTRFKHVNTPISSAPAGLNRFYELNKNSIINNQSPYFLINEKIQNKLNDEIINHVLLLKGQKKINEKNSFSLGTDFLKKKIVKIKNNEDEISIPDLYGLDFIIPNLADLVVLCKNHIHYKLLSNTKLTSEGVDFEFKNHWVAGDFIFKSMFKGLSSKIIIDAIKNDLLTLNQETLNYIIKQVKLSKRKIIRRNDKIFPNLFSLLAGSKKNTFENEDDFIIFDLFLCKYLLVLIEYEKFLPENKQPTFKSSFEKLIIGLDFGDDSKALSRFYAAIKSWARNIILMYSKEIGTIIIDDLILDGYITKLAHKRKLKNKILTVNRLIINKEKKINYLIPISKKLPSISQEKKKQFNSLNELETKMKSKGIHKNKNTSIYLKQKIITDHPFMEGKIKDYDLKDQGAGNLKINIPFSIKFFKQLRDIKYEFYKTKTLSKSSLYFMSAVFGKNIELFASSSTAYKKLINFLLDFKTTRTIKLEAAKKGIVKDEVILPPWDKQEPIKKPKYFITLDEIEEIGLPLSLILDMIQGAYAKKFEIIESFYCVYLYLHFEDFYFHTFYDLRGRNYPNPSIFNHLSKFCLNFFNFGAIHTECQVNDPNLRNITSGILRDALNELYPNLLNTLKLENSNQFVLNFNLLFELGIPFTDMLHAMILLQDYLNVYKNTDKTPTAYLLQGHLRSDVRSSGMQITNCIIRDYETALRCLIKPIGPLNQHEKQRDPYEELISRFWDYFDTTVVNTDFYMEFYSNEIQNYVDVISNILKFDSIEVALTDSTVRDNIRILYLKLIDNKEKMKMIHDPSSANFILSKSQIELLLQLLELNTPETYHDRSMEIFIKILDILLINHIWVELSKFRPYFQRKFVKHSIMISIYGGSKKTRKQKMRDSFNTQIMVGNTKISPIEYKYLNYWINYVDKQIQFNFNLVYSKLNFFKDYITKICRKKEYKIRTFNTSHVSFRLEPFKTKSKVKKIRNKSTKVSQILPLLDYNKINSSVPANWVQMCDATLAALCTRKFYIKFPNSFLLTNHDCFYYPYIFHNEFLTIFDEAFKEFYSSDQFKIDFGAAEEYKEFFNLRETWPHFLEEDINEILIKLSK